MATIRARLRQDGSLAYLAEVRIKLNGRLRRESKTFERRGQATEWAARVEKQLTAEGGDRRIVGTGKSRLKPLLEVRRLLCHDNVSVGGSRWP